MTTSDDANNTPEGRKGIKGYSNAYIDKIIEAGVYTVIWKKRCRPGDSEYGIFLGPATMGTNETESGEDVAIFMCHVIERKRDKSLRRTGKQTSRGFWYPQFSVPFAYAYDVGKALIELSGRKEVVAAKVETVTKPEELEKKRVDDLMSKLYGGKK
jgi:hypothetical protein